MVVKESSKVITKTTKPKVIIQTKKLNEPAPSTLSTPSHKGKWIWKAIICLLLIINLSIGFLNYLTSREQLRFTIMSNGGLENYQMLQKLYISPAFQQASTLSIYQLINRVEETLVTTQATTENQTNDNLPQ
jgi:hypothetical protein